MICALEQDDEQQDDQDQRKESTSDIHPLLLSIVIKLRNYAQEELHHNQRVPFSSED